MKLKTKLALMSIGVSSLMCAAITFSAVKSADTIAAAILVTPAQNGVYESRQVSVPAQTIDSANMSEMMALTASTATNNYNMQRFYVMAAIIAAGALLTWLLAAKMLKPLEKLTSEVKTVKPDSLAALTVVPKTNDEVGRLAEAFGSMTQQVGDAYEMQKSFSASAAHELRTPLAVLASEIDVFMLQSGHTAEEYSELVLAVRQSTDRLSGIVEDLLAFTNQNAVGALQSVSLKPLAEEIADELESLASQKNIEIETVGEDTEICADDALIQRALYNLVENAVKYSQSGTKVIIKIESNAIKVSDNGCGIPEEEKPHIFEPFYRIDKSRSRAEGGSGLGLAIVKQIAHKHGFTVSVADNKPSGSVFTIEF